MQEQAPAAWTIALPTIASVTGCEPEQVRAFLDSRHGRHFADDVQNALYFGANLQDAVDQATAKWMGWTIGRMTTKETGIPRGMAYLTGFVVQAAIDDEIYICPVAPTAINGGGLQMLEVTIKKGKTYRYYVPNRVGHFGAGASKICTIPAEPIEALVVAQVVDALSSPMVVQAVWDRARTLAPELTEPQAVLPMRQLASMWPNLFAAEQQRLVRLLIEKVVLSDTGLEIVWCDAGWHALSAELRPDTIGAELAEMEAA